MRFSSKLAAATVLVGLVGLPAAANPQHSLASSHAVQIHATDELAGNKSRVRVLSDHPGSATALTQRQKSEIRALLKNSQENKVLICTGASLANQRESMYRVVLLRAQLVCDYAKSINPDLKTTIQEKRTSARQFNGRVVVVSK
jgi:hypothetical protein